ncbi:MAG: S-methyl-5'-thioadenosine phosphorylase [Planctomycetes bacterium]|nr:S-methyl-5'-thioadenosine phosphorylase [Planctomycetota bacterium]
MRQAQVGIIGGTGLGDTLLQQAGGEIVHVETPFGSPSSNPVIAKWEGVDVAFIARHGDGHRFNPSSVPYRANIWALKQLGVTAVIASGATGSLREDIKPGELVICDQVIDKTSGRTSTFFDEGVVAHVVFADPFCTNLRSLLIQAGEGLDAKVHHTGTYVCMEGPQFSTRAESNMHRQWGGDLIGMTCMPEAKLAREAELCYALVALPTDYDCWRPVDPSVAADDLLTEIMGNLQRASDNAIALIRRALGLIADLPGDCTCRNALKQALWTDPSRIDPTIRKRLEPLIGRHLADNTGHDTSQ